MDRRHFLGLAPLSAALVAARPRAQGDALDARFEAVAALVSRKMAEYHVPGVALGVSVEASAWLRGFGVTSLDDPRPVTDDTLFTIASISKTMTATAVMKLVHEGKADLDAPIRSLLPEFAVLDEDATRRVSLWHCLTHTPGWEGQLSTEDRGSEALAHFVSTIMPTLPQLAAPGSVWSYNNAGFALAGRAIERVTGRGIHDAMRELVFAPLGLTRTVTRLTEAMTWRLTLGHRDRDGRTEVIRPFQTTSSTTAGGVLTSVADLMRYARFHLSDGTGAPARPYLSKAVLERMQARQVSKNATTDEMGLGWHRRPVGDVLTLAHGGTLNGHCLLLEIVPARSLAFAVLTNHVDGWRLVQDVEAAILREYADAGLAPGQRIAHRGVNEAMTFHATPLPVQPPLAAYAGVYRRPPVGSVTVRVTGDRLTVVAGDSGPETTVTFYGPDVAYAMSGSYTGMPYEFIRGDDGMVRWIRVNGRIARRDSQG